MALRDDITERFGPKLIDTLIKQFVDELNEVRERVGLRPRTRDELYSKLIERNDRTANYSWMTADEFDIVERSVVDDRADRSSGSRKL